MILTPVEMDVDHIYGYDERGYWCKIPLRLWDIVTREDGTLLCTPKQRYLYSSGTWENDVRQSPM